MGRKNTNFGVKYQELLVRNYKLNYTDMSAGTKIYIGYVVISIALITVMLAIELFYLTQICSFIGCLFEYLPLFIPVGFFYSLYKC